MKNPNLRYAGKNRLYLIESALIFILLFLKLFFFEKKMLYGRLCYTLSIMTVIFVGTVFLAVLVFSKKTPMAFLFTVYSVLSVIIFIDALYFSYFSKLPSVASLSSAKYLTGVTESILNLLDFKTFLNIVDLPLWLVYSVNFRNKFSMHFDVPEKNESRFKKASLISVSAVLCACIVSAVVTGAAFNYRARYISNELITYHLTDIAKVYFIKSQDFEISDSDYVSAFNELSDPDSQDTTVKMLSPELYGIANKRNVITIQVEALQGFVIDMVYDGQEITPNLNALIRGDSLYFENYYYLVGGGNTADAEFAINNSLYSPDTEAAYVKYCDNDYYGLPFILKENGYSGAYAFHAYIADYWNREKAYVKQGFDDYISGEDLVNDDPVGMGVSDMSFFKQATEIMKGYVKPFYSFLITLSSHYPYNIPAELRSLTLSDELEGTYVGNYLQTIHYVDQCIGQFIEYLKNADLYDNSIISIYGDHFGVLNDPENNRVMTELLGIYYEDTLFHVPMIINIPDGVQGKTISTVMSHVDFLPTFLHLLGYSNSKSIMFGHDVFETPDNVVYEQMHVSRGSFITNDIFLVYPRNGIYESTKIFDKSTGEAVKFKGEYDDIAQKALSEYNKCMYVLDNNLVVRNNFKK